MLANACSSDTVVPVTLSLGGCVLENQAIYLPSETEYATDLAIAGDSLTTAALSAEFADSAHLSRSVRAMMGVAPEFLFRQRERLVIHH